MGARFLAARARLLFVSLLAVHATSGCGGQIVGDAQTTAGGTAGSSGPGLGGRGGSAATCPGTGGPAMVRLPEGYCVDGTEVTRGQYQAWVATNPATSGLAARCSWKTNFVANVECMTSSFVYTGSGFEDHPQVCVDWCDAYAYCQAVGKRLCGKIGGGPGGFDDYDNASSSQWHNACVSDGAGNAYPYGSAYQPTTCNGYDNNPVTTVSTSSLRGCQSSVFGYGGVYDLSGNVWEWEDACGGPGGSEFCRLRGGSFGYRSDNLTCDAINYDHVSFVSSGIGLRCCS